MAYRMLYHHPDYVTRSSTMRFIGSIAHGTLDYLMAMLLIASPWLLNYFNQGAETWIPVWVGTAIVVYSLMTRYELGIFKVIPFKMHLGLDVLAGLGLALSPWLFGFAQQVYLPHVIFGLIAAGTAAMTHTYLDDPTKAEKHHEFMGEVRHH